jgi:integrase/recombinase XerD
MWIRKYLTFHLARHTFATTVTLSNGVPIESVSKMLRHTKITTTQVYAKVIERKLSDEMQLLKQKLSDMSEMKVRDAAWTGYRLIKSEKGKRKVGTM